MRKKLFTLAMILMLVISILPMAVYAEDPCTEHVDADGNCECDNCGAVVHNPGYFQAPGGEGHFQICLKCYTQLSEVESHSIVDGTCSVCDYSPCAGGNHTFGTEGIGKHHCMYCAYFTFCIDENADCVCDICCEVCHGDLWVLYDAEGHWEECKQCNQIIRKKENHYDMDNDGFCDWCYYQTGECTHPAENVVWYRDQDGHEQYCNKCGKRFVEWTEHDAPCDICGYNPCPNDQHTFGKVGFQKHKCQICGYWTDCVDADNDCVCDICGNEYHNLGQGWEIQSDDNYHFAICPVCGRQAYKTQHYDENQDGKCDGCGHAINGQNTDNPDNPNQPADSEDKTGLDDVPKTGDLSVIVLGVAALGFAACGVVLMKKWAV